MTTKVQQVRVYTAAPQPTRYHRSLPQEGEASDASSKEPTRREPPPQQEGSEGASAA